MYSQNVSEITLIDNGTNLYRLTMLTEDVDSNDSLVKIGTRALEYVVV